MAFESFKGFSENQIEQPRGSDVGFTDYLIDVPVGAVKGLSQAVQGLLSLGAMPIDYLANTDLLNGINDLFDKITPDTKTAVGDITSVIAQFGVPFGAAVKIAGGITKLKGISTMTQLGSLPTRAAKGTELVKRAGYYGTLGGLTDFAVSTPGKLGTLSDLTGLTQQTDFEGLTGKDRAVEELKGKLKFGAEGALIGGAVPLLPTAASVGFRYGIVPGAKVVGTVGGKALEYVVDKPLSFAINRIVGSKEKSILQQSLIKSGSLIQKGVEKTGLAGDWRHRPIEGGAISYIKRNLTRLADQFKSARGLTGELKSVQDSAVTKIAGQEKTLKAIGGRIEDAQRALIKNFKIKFDNGESILKLQIENNKVKDYILASGQTADDILATLPKDLHKDVKAFKDIIVKTNNKYKIFGADLKQMAMLDYDSYAKQRFGAFNNKKFRFNPLLENKAFDFFKEQIKKNPEMMTAITNAAAKSKTSVDVILNQQTKDKLLNFKKTVIQDNANPESLFKEVAKASDIDPKDVLKGNAQVPDVIKKLLSVEEGRTAGELAFKGAKDVSGKAITKDVATFNALNAGLDVVLSQGKQMYGKLAFDDYLKKGLNTIDNPTGLIHTPESMARLRIQSGPGAMNNLKNIASRERLPDIVTTSELFNGRYFAAPEIANALVGAKEITSGLYSIPFYKSFMALKAGAQISKTILSPMTQIRNFTTASMFPLANGLIGGRIGFKDAWGLTIGDIFQGAKTTPEKIAKIERLIERGVIDQNINVQEMRRVLEATKDGKISFSKMMNTPIMRKLTDIYQGADNFWKIYTDNFYQGSLKSAYGDPSAIITGAKAGTQAAKNADTFFRNYDDWFRTVAGRELDRINPLTGLPKTPLEVAEEASAYLVTNTVPTYSKVPMIIENIRNLPLGNFVAFPAEILRTTSNIISIGARELTSTNPFIRQMGARRLVGVSTVLGGIGYTTKKGAQYLTGVDDETMDSFQRSFAPPYQKNSTLIPVSAPDENGKFKYYNFSYSNPYDTLVAPANAILAAFSEGRLRQDNVTSIVMDALFGGAIDPNKRKGAITEFLQPFITESIGTERAFDVTVRGGRDSRGKVIYYPQDGADVIIAKSLNHILGGLSPGALTSSSRIWDGATGRFSDYGTQKDMSDEVVALLSGVRVEEAKPLASVPFILTSYGKDKSNIRSKFSRKAYSARTSAEEKLGAYSQYVVESYDSQNKMYQIIEDATNLGIDERTLKKLFEKRLTKTETRALFRGEFKPPAYSKNAFKSTVERLEAENPLEAEKIEEQNDVVMDIYDDVQRDLRKFELGQSLTDLQRELDESLSPGVEETRDLRSDLVAPTTGIEQVAELPPPPQIGTPVNQQVAAAGNTVGNQFNLFANNPNARILFPFG
jgi:hypothetical protein